MFPFPFDAPLDLDWNPRRALGEPIVDADYPSSDEVPPQTKCHAPRMHARVHMARPREKRGAEHCPPVAPKVMTRIGPRSAVAGTITLSEAGLLASGTVCIATSEAPYGLNRTSPPVRVGASRFVPVIAMVIPASPHDGANEVIVGAHSPAPVVERKVPVLVLVPPGFVIRML